MSTRSFYFKSLLKRSILASLVIVFLPKLVMASSVYLDATSENVNQGDVFLVTLKVSTQNKTINAVEGTIAFDSDKLAIKEVSTGGSIFSLWPVPATFSNEAGKLNFVGGAVRGYKGDNAEILKIIFLAKKEGAAQVAVQPDSALFLNDGKGTKISFEKQPLTVVIAQKDSTTEPKDEWQPIINKDTNPPEPFEVIIGQNSAIFGGNRFISFFTTDNESGLDHFEVKEGEGVYEKAESPHVLKDQSLQKVVLVKALDRAGNEREVALVTTQEAKPFTKNVALLLGVIVCIVLLRLVFAVIKRFKRH